MDNNLLTTEQKNTQDKNEFIERSDTISSSQFQSDYNDQSRPLILRIIVGCVNVLGYLFPQLAGKIIVRFFLTPYRRKKKEMELSVPVSTSTILHNDKEIKVFTAGSGPRILLVHGWASGSHRFSEMAEYLVNHGYSIIAFDFPAHGTSGGKRTNIRECGDLILTLLDIMGPFKAIIGHSFGGSASLFHSEQLKNIDYLITLGVPTTKDSLISPFFNFTGFSQRLIPYFVDELEKIIDRKMEELSPISPKMDLDLPLLIIHDKEDSTISVNDAKQLNNHVEDSQIFLTEKYSHSGILYQQEIYDKILRFINC